MRSKCSSRKATCIELDGHNSRCSGGPFQASSMHHTATATMTISVNFRSMVHSVHSGWAMVTTIRVSDAGRAQPRRRRCYTLLARGHYTPPPCSAIFGHCWQKPPQGHWLPSPPESPSMRPRPQRSSSTSQTRTRPCLSTPVPSRSASRNKDHC